MTQEIYRSYCEFFRVWLALYNMPPLHIFYSIDLWLVCLLTYRNHNTDTNSTDSHAKWVIQGCNQKTCQHYYKQCVSSKRGTWFEWMVCKPSPVFGCKMKHNKSSRAKVHFMPAAVVAGGSSLWIKEMQPSFFPSLGPDNVQTKIQRYSEMAREESVRLKAERRGR